MPPVTLDGPEELKARVGDEIGTSDWLEISQADVDAFADATGDHQWIHVDPERARESPFGGTIVHGYYTLSLAPRLQEQVWSVEGFAAALNYGLDKLRFPSPLPVGDRVRMRLALESADDIAGGVQAKVKLTFEREGADEGGKPVCVAESLTRFLSG